MAFLSGRSLPPELCSLSVDIAPGSDGKLPTEVRLFKAGENSTLKGPFIFDKRSAEVVMARYAQHGVDVMLDLEHLSTDEEAPNFDPDARGYGKLAVRNGELWLVDISWAGDGAERITSRRQRYVSPVFSYDKERRITGIHNVALTAMPATDHAMPLAASARGKTTMDWKTLCKLARSFRDAVKSGKSTDEAMATLAVDLKTLQAMGKLLGVDAGADLGSLIAAVIGFADELQNPATKKEAPPEAAPEGDSPVAMSAKANTAELETLRAETAKQAKLVAELQAERAARESTERRELVAELVKLGRELPATAWSDDEATTPRGSLGTMPMPELRERVSAFAKLGAMTFGQASKPPAAADAAITLSPSALERAKARGVDTEKLAAVRGRFRTVRSSKS